MNKLAYQLKELRNENREGSYGTQQARKEAHNLIASQLKELGFNQMNKDALKEKHAVALVDKWIKEGKAEGTMKNRMSHFRWWSKHVNLSHRVPANKALGIENRKYVTNISKAVLLEQKHLDKVNCPNIKDVLRLQAGFGMRREEGMKVNVLQADKGTYLKMQGSWCKNGRPRNIPIITPAQRELVNELKNKYGNSSLIPPEKSYVQQMITYKNTVPKAGLGGKAHGIRHQYIQDRYKAITGKDCPALGGGRQRDMSREERAVDREARLQIAEETGHSREQITSTYLGS